MIEREATTGREGKRQVPDPEKARAMLAAFSSVGVHSFDVTMTDIEGKKTGFQASRSSDEIAHAINRALDAATKLQQNYIIRPRSTSLTLIQLDDLDSVKAERAAQFAFMVLQTSPGNFQAWVAIKDAPDDETAAKDLARRLRKGSGADPTASGATRISGSLNFKTKYAPDFPLVEISQVKAGRVTTPAALELAGIVAPKGRTATATTGSQSSFYREAEPEEMAELSTLRTGSATNPRRGPARREQGGFYMVPHGNRMGMERGGNVGPPDGTQQQGEGERGGLCDPDGHPRGGFRGAPALPIKTVAHATIAGQEPRPAARAGYSTVYRRKAPCTGFLARNFVAS